MGVPDIGEVGLEPPGTAAVLLFNDVAGDGGATIIVGLLPGEAHAVFGDVSDAQVQRWFCKDARWQTWT